MQPPLRSCNPLLEPITLPDLRLDQDDPSGLDKQNAQVAIALFGYLTEDRAVSSRDLPRHQSEQAPKSRPLENTAPLPIAATIALEMIGPMPGTVINRLHPGSWLATIWISPDRLWIRSSSRRQSAARSSITCTIRSESTSVRL